MKIALFTVAAVLVIACILLITGSWLLCAGLCTAILAALLWLESARQIPATAAQQTNPHTGDKATDRS